MPLRDDLRGIGERVLSFYTRGGDAPYFVYVYDPRVEWDVRRDLNDLQLWLQAPDRAVACAAISLADLFWQALAEEGWSDALIHAEREAGDDHAALAEVHRSVGEILRQQPSLHNRVVEAIDAFQGNRTAVFLYRAGALYPAYRTSTLLDELRGRVRMPVTLLYPGSLLGDFGLKFMGRSEPAYGYRALIVPRGARP